MYHKSISPLVKIQKKAALRRLSHCLLLLVFARLIGHTAARLAGGLAGSLALAASAILGALAQVARLKGLDPFHEIIS
jgi:hypothetical protein